MRFAPGPGPAPSIGRLPALSEAACNQASGARGGDILQQFLVESIMLCLAGAMVGIGLGQMISAVVSSIASWPTTLSVQAIAISVLVATSIGIVFGFYPAWRASRLNPSIIP